MKTKLEHPEYSLARKILYDRIEEKKQRIIEVKNEINNLYKENALLCDDAQWYTEGIEQHPKRKYQRKENELHNKLIGRVHWIEYITDEDTGERINIQRNQVVKINGEWI